MGYGSPRNDRKRCWKKLTWSFIAFNEVNSSWTSAETEESVRLCFMGEAGEALADGDRNLERGIFLVGEGGVERGVGGVRGSVALWLEILTGTGTDGLLPS